MENTPLVSIICCTYNHESYISQCLDGFLMQKTNFPFEILVHDDASTDNTPDIIRKYEHQHPQILKPIYQKENKYSKGEDIFYTYQCSRAHGIYIAICEGDDYWIDPYKLQKQVDFLEKHTEFALVYTLSKVYDQYEHKMRKDVVGNEFKGFENLLIANRIPTLTTCVRTHILKKYVTEIKPQDKGWLMGDYPMWLWIAYHYNIKCLPEATTVYRHLQESASHSQNIQRHEKFTLSVIDITTFYIKKFQVTPTKEYLESIHAFYYDLYNRYIRMGYFQKAKFYANLINLDYLPTNKHKKIRLFYLRYIKFKLQKLMNKKNS